MASRLKSCWPSKTQLIACPPGCQCTDPWRPAGVLQAGFGPAARELEEPAGGGDGGQQPLWRRVAAIQVGLCTQHAVAALFIPLHAPIQLAFAIARSLPCDLLLCSHVSHGGPPTHTVRSQHLCLPPFPSPSSSLPGLEYISLSACLLAGCGSHMACVLAGLPSLRALELASMPQLEDSHFEAIGK